jgi:hypothetical protein
VLLLSSGVPLLLKALLPLMGHHIMLSHQFHH